jgi:hypothetical protein
VLLPIATHIEGPEPVTCPPALAVSTWVNPATTSQAGYARIAESAGLYLGTDASDPDRKLFFLIGYGMIFAVDLMSPNLWVADSGNHRVVRFSAAVLNSQTPAAADTVMLS